jgi:hypothetical protein
MKQGTLGPRDHGRSDLEKIGIQIAQNCGGLPLVLRALGQVMSESKDVKSVGIRPRINHMKLNGYTWKQNLLPSVRIARSNFFYCFFSQLNLR